MVCEGTDTLQCLESGPQMLGPDVQGQEQLSIPFTGEEHRPANHQHPRSAYLLVSVVPEDSADWRTDKGNSIQLAS